MVLDWRFVFFQNIPDWNEILTYFRGSELQNYFTRILEDNLQAVIKPQYVDQIPKAAKGSVKEMLDKKDDLKNQHAVCEALGMRLWLPTSSENELWPFRFVATLGP